MLNFLPLAGQVIYQKEQISLHELIKNKGRYGSRHSPKIGLVLSGGGARGISHVGVFKALEKYHIPINLIVGTSMGSVVGGFYAAGYNAAQLESIVKSIEWDDIFRDETERENLFLGQKLEKDRFLINIRFENWKAYLPQSLTSGQKILSIISEKLYNANFQMIYDFDALKIPFRAVATDLISGERVVIGEGDLAEAINASTTVPLLFSPVVWDSMLLVDGGLISNLPVDVAKSLDMDIIIVVDISSSLRNQDELNAPWEIADQVTTIMMKNQYARQLEQADIVVQPELSDISGTDFDKIDEMISAGEAAVDSLISDIRLLLSRKQKSLTGATLSYNDFQLKTDSVEHEKFSKGLYATTGNFIFASQIEEDIDYLMDRGIFSSALVQIKDSVLIYELDENRLLKNIHINGNLILPDSMLIAQIKHPVRQQLCYNDLYSDLNHIREFYHGKGYVLMDFKALSFDQEKGVLELEINEGVIDTIQIEGNKQTSEFVILREFPLRKTDTYNSNLVKKGIENIYNTQLFEKVSVNVKNIAGRQVLLIKVTERKYTVLRLGGKIGSERGAQGYVELANENFLGIENKISLSGRYGEKDRQISLNYRMDRIFKTFLTFAMSGYLDWKVNPYYKDLKKIGSYNEERLGVRILLGQQLRKLGQMSIELRLENAKDQTYQGTFDAQQNSELRTITIRSITDKRDRIAFTTKGIYNVWYWETGNEQILEGQENYTKAFVNLEGYYTYWQRHTFHLRGVIGVGDKILPFSEFFRIGGPGSFMGLHKYELTGRQLILSNLEYRFKSPINIFSDTYLGLRYDIAAIWNEPDLVFSGEDFFYGTGIWLGIDTVLGPFLLTYGDSTLKHGVFYISLGYDF